MPGERAAYAGIGGHQWSKDPTSLAAAPMCTP
jgi:hypothetical protein